MDKSEEEKQESDSIDLEDKPKHHKALSLENDKDTEQL